METVARGDKIGVACQFRNNRAVQRAGVVLADSLPMTSRHRRTVDA
jgi:hypothetical protein